MSPPASTAAVNVYSGGYLTVTGSWMITSPGTYPIRNEGGLAALSVDNLQTSNAIDPISPPQIPLIYRHGCRTNQPAGYVAGAGGSIVQSTSKATGVTINKLCGQITTSAAALAAGASVTFTVTNSQVAATDIVELVLASGSAGTGSYNYQVDKVSAGSFAIWLKNVSGGALSEALVFSFAVKKAVAA